MKIAGAIACRDFQRVLDTCRSNAQRFNGQAKIFRRAGGDAKLKT